MSIMLFLSHRTPSLYQRDTTDTCICTVQILTGPSQTAPAPTWTYSLASSTASGKFATFRNPKP